LACDTINGLVEIGAAEFAPTLSLSCHHFRSNEVRFWLSVLGYNLENVRWRLVLWKRIGLWSLTSLQQRQVKTGGRLFRHARYYRLPPLESHLARRPLAGMPRRIAAFPSPTGWARRRPKQISVLCETGEGKVFEEGVGEASVFDFEILQQPSEWL
jgi:hypothetical protein